MKTQVLEGVKLETHWGLGEDDIIKKEVLLRYFVCVNLLLTKNRQWKCVENYYLVLGTRNIETQMDNREDVTVRVLTIYCLTITYVIIKYVQ